MSENIIPPMAMRKEGDIINDSEEERSMLPSHSLVENPATASSSNSVNEPAPDTTTSQQATKAKCPLGCIDKEYTATGLLHHLQKGHPGHPHGGLTTRGIAKKYGIPYASEAEIAGQEKRIQTMLKKRNKVEANESSDDEPAYKRPRAAHRSGKKDASLPNKENTPQLQQESDNEDASSHRQKRTTSAFVQKQLTPSVSSKKQVVSARIAKKQANPAPTTKRQATPASASKSSRVKYEHTTGPQCPLKCSDARFTALGLLLHFKKCHKDHPDGNLNVEKIAAKYNAPIKSEAQIQGYLKRSANKWAKEAVKKAAMEKKVEDDSSAETDQDDEEDSDDEDDEDDDSSFDDYIPKSIRQAERAASAKPAKITPKIILRNSSGRMPLPASKPSKKRAPSPEPEPRLSPKRLRRTPARYQAYQPESSQRGEKMQKSGTPAEQAGDASPKVHWTYAEALASVMDKKDGFAGVEDNDGDGDGSSQRGGSQGTDSQKTSSQETDTQQGLETTPAASVTGPNTYQAPISNERGAPPRRLCRTCSYGEARFDFDECQDCMEDGPLRMIAAEALIMMSRGA